MTHTYNQYELEAAYSQAVSACVDKLIPLSAGGKQFGTLSGYIAHAARSADEESRPLLRKTAKELDRLERKFVDAIITGKGEGRWMLPRVGELLIPSDVEGASDCKITPIREVHLHKGRCELVKGFTAESFGELAGITRDELLQGNHPFWRVNDVLVDSEDGPEHFAQITVTPVGIFIVDSSDAALDETSARLSGGAKPASAVSAAWLAKKLDVLHSALESRVGPWLRQSMIYGVLVFEEGLVPQFDQSVCCEPVDLDGLMPGRRARSLKERPLDYEALSDEAASKPFSSNLLHLTADDAEEFMESYTGGPLLDEEQRREIDAALVDVCSWATYEDDTDFEQLEAHVGAALAILLD